MRNFTPYIFVCLLLCACSKNSDTPNNNTTTGTSTGGTQTKQSAISVLINNQPMAVSSIDFNRNGGSFNFTAQNALQKVDVTCFHFYEQSWASFMYSDSIVYSTRPDSLSAWNSTTAPNNANDVYFNCCTAPLQDPDISGTYNANFNVGKGALEIKGDFDLLFK